MSYTNPGVYIQELPSPVHTITGAPTSITAFVGYTPRGIDALAQTIFSFSDFQRLYGGLATDSTVSYAVAQFYQNAPGSQAYVVRVPKSGAAASVSFGSAGSTLTFTSRSSGLWPNGNLLIDIDQGAPLTSTDLTADSTAFNLTVTNLVDGTSEPFPGLSLDNSRQNYVTTVINDVDNGSHLVTVDDSALGSAPTALHATGITGSGITAATFLGTASAATGGTLTNTAKADLGLQLSASQPSSFTGLPVTVTVFKAGDPLPQSLSGIATAVQRAINTVLGQAVPGASASVTLTAVNTTAAGATTPAYGQALRINVTLPGLADALLGISAVSGASADALTAFGLDASSGTPNPFDSVAHYALGSGHGASNGWGDERGTTAGAETGPPQPADLTNALTALDKVDVFNLLSIPDATRTDLSASDAASIYSQAISYVAPRRAFLLVDPPASVTTVSAAIDWISTTLGVTDPNGAAFWPRVRFPDPLNNYALRSFPPSGVVAGVYAATDGSRGVWKAPAGINATLNGVQSLSYAMNDSDNGELNPRGLNCLRSFPVYGRVLWGARTLQGADALASQWKYVPVRRMASFLELSLYQGLQWVVFEPNAAPLWASIRLNVESFLQTYFLKGAFAGTTPDTAYFVKCDSETTTPTDVGNGVVNILVGFAPLSPAEFVVIQLEQLAGQASS
jgi:phage tail sheath protein FI